MTLLKTLSNNSKKVQTLDDEELVYLIVFTKNTWFFEILLARYDGAIYNKILGFINNDEEAAELTKTLFVTLFSEIHLFKGPYNFSSWLYERAYRLCVDYLNTSKKIKYEADLTIEQDDRLHIEVSDAILFRMKPKKLIKAMSLITPEEKAVLMLRYQDGVSMMDMALLLEMDDNSIIDILRNAKARIVETYNKL